MPGKLSHVVISLVIAMGGINLVFAAWEENLDIVGTVRTGEFCVKFDEGYCINYDGPGKNDLNYYVYPYRDTDRCPYDVGTTYCDVEEYQVTITLENVYPCYQTFVRFKAINCGTIPAKLKDVEVYIDDPDGLKDYVEFGVGIDVRKDGNWIGEEWYPEHWIGAFPRTDANITELETALENTINAVLAKLNSDLPALPPNHELWYDFGFHIKDGAPQKANLTITIKTIWTQFNVQ